ncbi:MAG: hypothetical protein WDZ83_06055 [Rhizobiaceae bacterium]
MTSPDDTSQAQIAPEVRAAPALRLVVLIALAVIAVAIPWQLRWGTVADTSWIITICERLYAGERLYTDIVETNPPFSVWLYMPAYIVSVWLRVAPEFLVHAYAYAICAFGLGFAAIIARKAGFAENAHLFALLPVFIALLLLLPGNAFTERDHLGTALLGPLLALTAWRIAADVQKQPGWRIAVLAGLSGSVIVLIKPYYVLVIIGPALYLAWRKRSLRPLFGIEYWSAGIACLVYLAAVLWVYPQFTNEILPLLSETYLRIKLPFWMPLQRYGAGYVLILVLLTMIRPGLPLSPLAAVLSIASAAGMAVMVYQAKGWPYHAYPAVALGLAAVLCQAVRPPFETLRQLGRIRVLLLAVAVVINAVPFMTTQKPDARLATAIREAHERPTVAFIGTDIAAGHPLTRMAGGKWVSAYGSDWLGLFALYLAGAAQRNGDPAADRFRMIASGYAAFKLEELIRTSPDILIVQKDDAVWRDYFAGREGFSRFMLDYRLLGEDETTFAYMRDVRVMPDGSPAAW